MLYKMGHVAYSTDVCASRVEVVVPGMIERAIDVVLAPIRAEMKDYMEFIDVHMLIWLPLLWG